MHSDIKFILISEEKIARRCRELADAINHDYVGTEHILLGLTALDGTVSNKILASLGITFRKVRLEIEKMVGVGDAIMLVGEIPFTPRAKKALECAYEIAKSHSKTKISSENLLYAITRQKECLAMKVLEALGTDVLEIKYGIRKEIGED